MKQRSWGALITEFVLTALILLMCGALYAISKGYHPTVAGYQVLRVLTQSMSPVLQENDLIIVKRVPRTQLAEGDIITFISDDPYLFGVYNTHRIYRIEMSEEGIRYITKGDLNDQPDYYPVYYDQIAGKYLMTIPYGDLLGSAISSMSKNRVYFLVVMLPLLLCLLSYLWQVFFILVFDTGKEEPEREAGEQSDEPEHWKENQTQESGSVQDTARASKVAENSEETPSQAKEAQNLRSRFWKRKRRQE